MEVVRFLRIKIVTEINDNLAYHWFVPTFYEEKESNSDFYQGTKLIERQLEVFYSFNNNGIYIYIYMYIYMCVCVCVSVENNV